MANWQQIEDSGNRFRLLCSYPNCSLSILNLLNGVVHITTLHNNSRHSMTLTPEDMLFVVSQYLNSISKEDRDKLLDFFKSF